MTHTKEQFKQDLEALGVREKDVVLMHSSYKSLGGIEGGAKAFFEAFSELLGEAGTLVLPSLSFETVTPDQPVFDRQSTPSCVGYLSEYFRTQVTGVVRSLHATHSCCAVGKYAKELIADHEKDTTPVGANSPLRKLPDYGGKILMLGCNPARNTFLHGVEETVTLPYGLTPKIEVIYTLIDGERTLLVPSFRHNFLTADGRHIAQRYDRVPQLLGKDEVRFGKVLDADCCLMDAGAVFRVSRQKMLEDPCYFVDMPK